MPPDLASRWGAFVEALASLDREREGAREGGGLGADRRRAKVVLRDFQVAVEALIDLMNHAIARRGLPKGPQAAMSAEALRDAGLLSAEDAERLVDWIRFRNVIVHLYAKVDFAQVHDRLVGRLNELRSLGLLLGDLHKEELGDAWPGA